MFYALNSSVVECICILILSKSRGMYMVPFYKKRVLHQGLWLNCSYMCYYVWYNQREHRAECSSDVGDLMSLQIKMASVLFLII